MTVYDTTYELAKQIKESREYLDYKEKKDIVYKDEKLKKEIEEFQKMQYEVQLEAMQGGKEDETKIKELQEIYTNLLQNEDVKKYFEYQVRFNVMLADVNKIIGEAVKDVLQ